MRNQEDSQSPSDDSPAAEEPTIAMPSEEPEISGYRILRLLGRGGMGRVYLAEDTTLRRRVAIKVVSEELSENKEAHSRFLREARTMATVEHPHIVRVYGFGATQGCDYLVMEYVEGESLSERIRREGALPINDTLEMLRQMIDALNAAWSKGIVHRDLKPANILLDEDGNVRVADFGLAKSLQLDDTTTLTQGGQVLGTPQYISPEQARGEPEIDFRSDIYSLGIVLYEMLTGKRPYKGETPYALVEHHLHTPLPCPHEERPEIPEPVDGLPGWMTRKERSERPESYKVLRQRVEALVAGEAPVGRAVPVKGRRIPWSRAALLALLLLTVAGALLVKIGQHRIAAAKRARAEFRMVLAPLHAATAAAEEEGQVMRDLLFSSLAEALEGEPGVQVLTPDTDSPPRTKGEAKTFGEQHLADVTIWGRVVVLKGETVIQPRVTEAEEAEEFGLLARMSYPAHSGGLFADDLDVGRGVGALRAIDEAKDQLALRQTKAEEIRDLGVILAATRFLEPANRADEALKLLEQVSSVESLYQQGGIRHRRTGGLEAAIHCYRRVLEIAPDHIRAMNRLAGALFDSEHPEEAMELCHRIIAIDPSQSWVYRRLASAFRGRGELDKAIAVLEQDRALNLGRNRVAIINASRLAWYYRRQGQLEQAVSVLSHCLSDGPEDGWGCWDLPALLEWLDRPEEARAAAARIAAKRPSGGVGLLLDMGSYRQAQELLTRSGLDELRHWVHTSCGLGEHQQAIERIDEGVAQYRRQFGSRRWLKPSSVKQFVAVALGLSADMESHEYIGGVSFFNQEVAREWRARVHVLAGNPAKALAELRGLGESSGWIWGGYQHPLALIRYLEQDVVAAADELRGAERLGVQDQFLLFLCLTKLKQPQAARALLDELKERAARDIADDDGYSTHQALATFLGAAMTEDALVGFKPLSYYYLPARGSWDCELYWYLGALHAANANMDKAREYLQRSLDTGLRHKLEWILAKNELEELD